MESEHVQAIPVAYRRQPSSDVRFYENDCVYKLREPHEAGVVRGSYDDESPNIYLGHLDHTTLDFDEHLSDAEQRILEDCAVLPRNTVLVKWALRGSYEVVLTKHLTIIQRPFHVGDIVKRSLGDVMSGTVLNTVSLCTLQKLLPPCLPSGTRLEFSSIKDSEVESPNSDQHLLRDVLVSELRPSEDITPEPVVLYQDWVGIVTDYHCFLHLRLSNGTVVEVDEDDVEPADESNDFHRVGDVVKTKKATFRSGRWIFGRYSPNIETIAIIVHIHAVQLEINWMHKRPGSHSAMPPTLPDPEEVEADGFHIYNSYARPQSSRGDSICISYPELDCMSTRVRFSDTLAAIKKYSGLQRGNYSPHERQHTLGYDMNVLDVVGIRTTVRVRWQDCTIAEYDSVDLVEDHHFDDEHSAWPSEITLSIDKQTVEGLEGVTSPERVGIIQSTDPYERMAKVRWCPEANVHYSSTEEDHTPVTHLVQSIIGIAGGVTENVSLYDLETPGALNLCRGDMVLVNDVTASGLQGLQGINWFGSVVDDLLDGTVAIRLGAATPVRDVRLRREEFTLAIRYSDLETESISTDHDDSSNESDDSDDDDTYFLNQAQPTYEGEDGQPMDIETAEDADWESVDDEEMVNANDKTVEEDGSPSNIPDGTTAEKLQLPSYQLHDTETPSDHHFIGSAETSNPARMKHIQKEHRIFQKAGAIPAGVYVHSWEARLDLWRVLFIGPKDTPYADAPFIVDFCLPSDYPNSPPEAFFHSWKGERGLGGVGPVNPNLYENGTICLSLLGTWSGKKQENWNSVGSTLLQVVVSILGLVLVKEPYFNEAGYETQIGTEEAKRPSILYNERIVLRSLNFAISAVAALHAGRSLPGMSGVEDDLRWLYLASEGAHLLNNLDQRVKYVLAISTEGSKLELDGLDTLSQGACISLRKVLARLEQLPAAM